MNKNLNLMMPYSMEETSEDRDSKSSSAILTVDLIHGTLNFSIGVKINY